MKKLQNYIAGEFVNPVDGEWLDVFEPATGKVYTQSPASTGADVQHAYEAAQSAFPEWSGFTAERRAGYMYTLADLIERDLTRLTKAESCDTGKPIGVARTVDIPRAAANFRFFAGAILHSESTSHDTDGQAINYTLRKPRGVAGLISPWNLPLYLLSWKIAPAIATGNTCVAKPAEVTPMTAYLLGELITEAGFPPGVVNIVHGLGDPCGKAIVEHQNIPTISFTGSTAVGKWIGATAGGMLKRVSLELGGKNPNIIFADADLDQAVENACRGAFSNQGQICLCGARILVEESIAKEFSARLVERTRKIRLGDPSVDGVEFGALVSREHLAKVAGMVDRAKELGGKVLTGGKRYAPDSPRCNDGYFYEPTIITNLDMQCEIQQNEIFGPVVTIATFKNEQTAVELANSTAFGLAAMIWTRDVSRAHRVAQAIEAGIVWVNCWMLRDLRTPFGGAKASGVGREGGTEALRFFTEPKNVCVKL
ncbi:MAG: 2-hydroxymuconic semialdehyde dehydrogenase [Phycisphaera sp.]|nr:MAG: 2-hydroxymuconic semialdehyde dehydrogenase [Phycisphaera sp.]